MWDTFNLAKNTVEQKEYILQRILFQQLCAC